MALASVTSSQAKASLKEQRVDEVDQSWQRKVQLFPFQSPTLTIGKNHQCIRNIIWIKSSDLIGGKKCY